MSRFCPTCGRAELAAPSPTDGSAGATGEWAVPAIPEDLAAAAAADAALGGPVVPTPMPYAGSDRCSWCGKQATMVKRLLTGPGVQICDECVALCTLILRDEQA